MRQFQSTYLFRATATNPRGRRTFYLIAADEREAEVNANRQLNSDEKLSSKLANLGRQCGDYFLKSNAKAE
jgi:hypothetical protein